MKILEGLKYTMLDDSFPLNEMRLKFDIVNYIVTQVSNYKNSRQELEELWLMSWANYFGTRTSEQYLRSRIYKLVGDVKSDWRHKVNVGKTYEVVETLHAYLMGALFPNTNWFDLQPVDPEYLKVAYIVKEYLKYKLVDWKFMPNFANFLRQLIIIGTSVIALPWEDDEVKFKCLDMFDCFFNPDDEDSDFIRKIRKTRSDIIIDIKKGFYDKELLKPFDIVRMSPTIGGGYNWGEIEFDYSSTTMNTFQGINVTPYRMTDRITLYEFWGDIQLPYMIIENVCITIIGGYIARVKPNTYKSGKPFVTGVYTPVMRQHYGLSGVQGVLGMLQQLNNVTNQLLDGAELAVNPMYTMIADGTLRPQDVFTEPGRVLAVQSHDAVRPLPPPLNNFNLSFQQFNALEATIDKNTGTGPLIGAGQPRGGERVTAREIAAVQEAGGNRLLNVYVHLKNTVIIDMLLKLLQILKQFKISDEQFPIEDKTGTKFPIIGKRELATDYKVYPKGVDHIAERQDQASRLIEVLNLVTELPDVNEKIDVWKIIEDVISNVLYMDPTKYMKVQEEEQLPIATNEPAMSASMQQVLENNLAVDGGQTLLSNLFGTPNESTVPATIDPAALDATSIPVPPSAPGAPAARPTVL